MFILVLTNLQPLRSYCFQQKQPIDVLCGDTKQTGIMLKLNKIAKSLFDLCLDLSPNAHVIRHPANANTVAAWLDMLTVI